MAWTTSATPRGSFVEAGDLATMPSVHSDRDRRLFRRDPLTPLVWLSAAFHVMLLAEHAVPMALAGAGRSQPAAGPDLLALAAVLTGAMVAALLMRRSALAAFGTSQPDAEAGVAPAATTGVPSTGAVRTGGDRLHAWSELSAHVSHELRTPLNAVIGFTDVMHSELHGPVGHDRYREYLGHIRASGEALLKATEDTLAVTHMLAEPAIRTIAPVALAEAIAEARDRSARAEAIGTAGPPAWSCAVAADLAVEADPRAFRQALVNLLTAARRHAGGGGRITVRAGAAHGAVALDITSTSPSAASGAQDKIGLDSRFAAGDERYPLSLARALLELQGARLVETRRGPALVMTVSLAEARQHDMALFS